MHSLRIIFLSIIAISCSYSAHHGEKSSPLNYGRDVIIGDNDLVPVEANGENIPERLRPLIDAIGILKDVGCTASHVGNGLVITAGHCFYHRGTNGLVENDRCDDLYILWGFRKNKAPYLRSECKEILAAQYDDDKDFAIIKVFPIPEPKLEVDLSEHVSFGEEITVFGHPLQRPLEWSGLCSASPNPNNASYPPIYNFSRHNFSHQCDTQVGNSGSAIISNRTLKVVGIHNGGIRLWNYAVYLTDTPLFSFIPR